MGSATVLVMLDLSEVFDIISHGIFLDLQCFSSFLKRWFQLPLLHRSGSRLHLWGALVAGLDLSILVQHLYEITIKENIRKCRIPNNIS